MVKQCQGYHIGEHKMMFQSKKQPWIITLSIHIYRQLIRQFPSEFQDEYGEVTLQDFRHCCRSAYECGGICGVLRLWPSMFTGAIADMGKERLSEATRQKKSKSLDDMSGDHALVDKTVSTVSTVLAASGMASLTRIMAKNYMSLFPRIRKRK